MPLLFEHIKMTRRGESVMFWKTGHSSKTQNPILSEQNHTKVKTHDCAIDKYCRSVCTDAPSFFAYPDPNFMIIQKIVFSFDNIFIHYDVTFLHWKSSANLRGDTPQSAAG